VAPWWATFTLPGSWENDYSQRIAVKICLFHKEKLYMRGISLGGLIYMVIGLVVANSDGYFAALGTLSGLLSAVLAVLLWPLLILGANLHLLV
jgi:hypothetical protein